MTFKDVPHSEQTHFLTIVISYRAIDISANSPLTDYASEVLVAAELPPAEVNDAGDSDVLMGEAPPSRTLRNRVLSELYLVWNISDVASQVTSMYPTKALFPAVAVMELKSVDGMTKVLPLHDV